MKKLLAVVILALAPFIFGFTLSWDQPMYTDNTAIGPEAQGIYYNIEMDGTQVATKISATTWIIPAVPKKSAHTFRAQAELGTLDNTGQPIRSAWSPPLEWASPMGNPGAPGQLRVVAP